MYIAGLKGPIDHILQLDGICVWCCKKNKFQINRKHYAVMQTSSLPPQSRAHTSIVSYQHEQKTNLNKNKSRLGRALAAARYKLRLNDSTQKYIAILSDSVPLSFSISLSLTRWSRVEWICVRRKISSKTIERNKRVHFSNQ